MKIIDRIKKWRSEKLKKKNLKDYRWKLECELYENMTKEYEKCQEYRRLNRRKELEEYNNERYVIEKIDFRLDKLYVEINEIDEKIKTLRDEINQIDELMKKKLKD